MNTMTLHIPEHMVLQAQNMGLYDEQVILSAFQRVLDEQQQINQQSSELQQRFFAWRERYQHMQFDDDWTDEMHDELWDNVRDKNDVGRDVVFE